MGLWCRVDRFLAKEETIVPPYRFGVYDVLVLPPSFPYGGMVSVERLDFDTQRSAILRDRS